MTVQLLIRAQCVGVPQLRNTGGGRERKKGRTRPPETQGRKWEIARPERERERKWERMNSTHLGQMMLSGETQPIHCVGTAVCPLPKLVRRLREGHVRGDSAVYYCLWDEKNKNYFSEKPVKTISVHYNEQSGHEVFKTKAVFERASKRQNRVHNMGWLTYWVKIQQEIVCERVWSVSVSAYSCRSVIWDVAFKSISWNMAFDISNVNIGS